MDPTLAVDIAGQAIGYALGIGFQGWTRDDAVRLIREGYTRQFGSVFESIPDDASILAHLSADSSAGLALARWKRGEIQRDDFDRKLGRAADELARDLVWAGHEAAGALPPADSTFRFPMARAPSRAKLLHYLQDKRSDARKKRTRPSRAKKDASD